MLLLEVDGLDGWYGRAQTLFGVSLNVQAGEAVVLLGRNGAGKSTTLKAIMGLEVERRGEIWFGGERIDKLPAHRIARLGLGYVPEDRRIFSGLTVDENLERRAPPGTRRSRLDAGRVVHSISEFECHADQARKVHVRR